MDHDSALFPLIPSSTVRAARALYGRGNLYLRLGDRLNHLTSKFDSGSISAELRKDKTAFLALLLIIQYAEKLTDAELADAIEQRMELRYALHLPTPGHRINPHSLCEFRSRVLRDPEYHALFQEMFNSIYPEILGATTKEDAEIDDVLHSICVNEAHASAVEALLRSMEALSATHFDWLRGIALPHWYQRYSHPLVASPSENVLRKQDWAWDEIKGDIEYLLQEIRKSNLRAIMAMPEIKTLDLIWGYLTDPESIKDCEHCIKRIYFMKGGPQ